MWKAVEGIAEALKALAATVTDRVKQWFAVRDARNLVYADTAYNISLLLEARSALGRNDDSCVSDLIVRRPRIENQNREPACLLREVNTIRSICDKLGYLRDVYSYACDEFPQELEQTLAFVDSRIINGELNKRRLLRVASAETRKHIKGLFHERRTAR